MDISDITWSRLEFVRWKTLARLLLETTEYCERNGMCWAVFKVDGLKYQVVEYGGEEGSYLSKVTLVEDDAAVCFESGGIVARWRFESEVPVARWLPGPWLDATCALEDRLHDLSLKQRRHRVDSARNIQLEKERKRLQAFRNYERMTAERAKGGGT